MTPALVCDKCSGILGRSRGKGMQVPTLTPSTDEDTEPQCGDVLGVKAYGLSWDVNTGSGAPG